jgi:succinyl-CoA synthetase beta subunit
MRHNVAYPFIFLDYSGDVAASEVVQELRLIVEKQPVLVALTRAGNTESEKNARAFIAQTIIEALSDEEEITFGGASRH